MTFIDWMATVWTQMGTTVSSLHVSIWIVVALLVPGALITRIERLAISDSGKWGSIARYVLKSPGRKFWLCVAERTSRWIIWLLLLLLFAYSNYAVSVGRDKTANDTIGSLKGELSELRNKLETKQAKMRASELVSRFHTEGAAALKEVFDTRCSADAQAKTSAWFDRARTAIESESSLGPVFAARFTNVDDSPAAWTRVEVNACPKLYHGTKARLDQLENFMRALTQ